MKRSVRLVSCLRVVLSGLIGLAMAHGSRAADAPLSSDQQTQLSAVRVEALAYIGKLPNFICTQVTQREVRTIDSAGSMSLSVRGDEIEETLTYFGQREHYEVLSVSGRKVTGVEHAQITGALSTGEFGSALRSIFDPRSNTAFSWGRTASLRGRQVSVFVFQVPVAAGAPITDSRSRKTVIVSYSGQVFVDAETREILRFTTHFNLPRGFFMSSAEQVVDYRPIEIAGKNHNLPFHSEVRIEEAGYVYLNKIDFKSYRKFEAQSTIRYGAFAEPPASSQPPLAPGSTPVATAGAGTLPPQPDPETRSSATQVAQTEPPVAQVSEAKISTGQSTAQPEVAAVQQAPAPSELLPIHAPETPQAAKLEPPKPVTEHAEDQPVQLKLNAELVLVPVVVRDSDGRAVGDLTRDDFEILDKGKRQEITAFSLETHGYTDEEKRTAASAAAADAVNRNAQASTALYLFDDVHMTFGDLGQVRQAAERQIDSLQAGDEAAILSTSGLVQLPFTSDKAKLHEVLNKLRPSPLGDRGETGCPKVSYYQADQMLNVYSQDLAGNPPLKVAYDEAMDCLGRGQDAAKVALPMALNAARRAESQGKQDSRNVLLALRDVVRWLGQRPGRKNLILVSPGFIVSTDLLQNEDSVIEQAIGVQVSISTLDARGLYTLFPSADAGFGGESRDRIREKMDLTRQDATASGAILMELADATGGASVRNTNDLFGGLQRLAALPEYTYVLGFRPQSQKHDGILHPLKVKLTRRKDLTALARRGYYMPKQ